MKNRHYQDMLCAVRLAAAVLAATILIVGSVVGYGLHRVGTVGKPFSDDGRLKVMASFYPMYDFAQKVGGDKVEIRCKAYVWQQ